jgi:choline dehydrogenase
MVVIVIQTHPRSAGTIRLRSTDPFDHPIIKPNYFGDPSDIKTLVAGTYMSFSYSFIVNGV